MFLKGIAVGMYATNCYIVSDDLNSDGIVIDPGAESRSVMEVINKGGLKITDIVITHGHVDHIGAVEEVKNATGAAIAMNADDVRMASRYIKTVDRLLNDGDKIMAGKLEFKVMLTPGHSPGGLCLLGNGILFSGDTLFNLGIGRTDFFGGNITKLMNSIHSRLMVLPDDTVVYPGHGPETTIGEERRHNPFLRK